MNIEIFKDKVRIATKEDYQHLEKFSYSKLSTFLHCPMQYKLKYIDGHYTSDTTLALELGSLCHKALEDKGNMIIDHKPVDMSKLKCIIDNGVEPEPGDTKTTESLLGASALAKKYFMEWGKPDSASGMTYPEKMKIFDKVLEEEMTNTEWQPKWCEHPFEFVWNERAILSGFIDRVDVRKTLQGEEFRTIDYKTSKKIFAKNELPTSLQFGIYALAIFSETGQLPVESLYRFILIDDQQNALTKGWEKRLDKKLDKIFDSIEELKKTRIYKPCPTPLCHWCAYCKTNHDAHEFKDLCEYHSLWTPENKTFDKAKDWDDLFAIHKPSKLNAGTRRKLVF